MQPVFRMRVFALLLGLLLVSLAVIMIFVRIDETVSCTGKIEPAELAIVRAKEARIVESIEVEEGEEVAAGRILARLDTRALDEALAAQVERIGVLRAERSVAVATLERVSATDFAERLELARLELGKAEERQKLAAAETARIRKLYDQDWASQSQLDKAEAAARIAAMDVEAARQRLAMLESDPELRRIEEAKAQIAHIDAQIEAAAAASERLSGQIRDSAVTAPRAGRIISIAVDRGQLAAAGGALFAIDAGGGLVARVRLPEDSFGKAAVGQRARIASPAFPARLHGYAYGELIFAGESVTQGAPPPYFEGIVRIDEKPFPLKYGSTVDVEVMIGTVSPYEMILGRKPRS